MEQHTVGDKLNPDRVFNPDLLLAALKKLDISKEIWVDVDNDYALQVYPNMQLIILNLRQSWDYFWSKRQQKQQEVALDVAKYAGGDVEMILKVLQHHQVPDYAREDAHPASMTKHEEQGYLAALDAAGFDIISRWNGEGATSMSTVVKRRTKK